MKTPVVTGKEVLSVLQKNGFAVVRWKGSHAHLTKGSLQVTVPVHSNDEINPGVLRSIARQAGFEPNSFFNLF
ncbi:MAG: type II toxin-antitoxin system HicA family toxin [Candidatus Micrarchaeia archaeon]